MENDKENKDSIPLPDYINFIFILDSNFPKNPPKVLSKTKVYKIYIILFKVLFPFFDGWERFIQRIM